MLSATPFNVFLAFRSSKSVANTKSAEKRNRQAQKHRARNQHVISTLRTQVRKAREAIGGGDAPKTQAELAAAVRLIAKAASKGVLHKAQAARRISRLTKAAHAKAQPAAAAK
jgi:small subunit ribosomal protein S20